MEFKGGDRRQRVIGGDRRQNMPCRVKNCLELLQIFFRPIGGKTIGGNAAYQKSCKVLKSFKLNRRQNPAPKGGRKPLPDYRKEFFPSVLYLGSTIFQPLFEGDSF